MYAISEPQWSELFDAWWKENRVATHQVKAVGGLARNAFKAGFKAAASSVGVEQGASIAKVAGSSPARQATSQAQSAAQA